jgi:hypothetical protein
VSGGLDPTRRLIVYSKDRKDTARHANSLRLSWLGHVDRMESERTPKCLLNGEILEVRRRGKPRKRWLQNIKE